jgi:hypothetical protein
MNRGDAIKEQTDEDVAKIPPGVGNGGSENDGYQGADEKDDRAVENEVCQPTEKKSELSTRDLILSAENMSQKSYLP